MYLYLSGHGYHFECENLCRVFYPYSRIVKTDIKENMPMGQQALAGEPFAGAEISKSDDAYEYAVWISQDGRQLRKSECYKEDSEYLLTGMLFKLLCEFTAQQPQWGMLTGIHPVKLYREYFETEGEEAADERFGNEFFVSGRKLDLVKRALEIQYPYIKALTEKDFCLYVGIPFCPTKCSYCSFVSQSIEKTKKLIDPFFQRLLDEIKKTAEIVKTLGLSLISVYIGGGTPTTLSAEQLEKLCGEIHDDFDFSRCTEFTIEAGRPDTITAEKLLAMKRGGVSRISINPQSLSDKVLAAIGRLHTAADVKKAFDMAAKAGFESINSDLIVGLPGDDLESFKETLSGVLDMGASNITVHALALKRASEITGSGDYSSHSNQQLANDMMDYASQTLEEAGFSPYYMYRQSRMAGNLENIGWCKQNDVCAYNIYTMDESVSIIACGAGGVTKLKAPFDRRLERIFNFKYPHEYINRHHEIIRRKEGVAKFYEQFR